MIISFQEIHNFSSARPAEGRAEGGPGRTRCEADLEPAKTQRLEINDVRTGGRNTKHQRPSHPRPHAEETQRKR